MMRSAILTLVALVFTGSVIAQEPNEHLKGFAPFIGTWRYEGPCLEDLPNAKKGTNFVIQFSWRWILNKQVLMEDLRFELEGSEPFVLKALSGWNAADKKIVHGSMDSAGGMALGVVTLDPEAKTSTLTLERVDAEGKKTMLKVAIESTGKDTMKWQTLERSGLEGKSPIYTLKRVKRARGKKAAK